MTQSGQTSLYDWPETVLGQIPSGPAPTGRQVRLISENLFAGPNLQDSPEVTPGNEPEDQTINGYSGAGDIQIAFSPRNYDHWLESLMWNTFADVPGSASTDVRTGGTAEVTYDAGTRTLTTTGSWTNAPVDGDHVLVTQSSNAYLNSVHRVSSSDATNIVLAEDGKLSSLADITVAEDIKITRGQRLTNTLTPGIRPIGFEKQIARTEGTFLGATATQGAPDIDFTQFLGAVPTRAQLQGTGDTPITGQFSFELSRQQNSSEANGGATVMAGTSAYDSTPIFQGIECLKKVSVYVPDMSATAGDAGIIEDTLRMCPQSFQLEIANGLTTTQLMCAEPEKDFQFGEPLLSLQLSGIYDSPFSRVAYDNQYDAVVEFVMMATNGEGYLFRMPRAKVQVARVDTPGRRQVLAGELTVKAFKNVGSPAAGDSGRAVEIYRFRQS